MKTFLQSAICLAARILLSQIFIISGLGHLFDWNGTIKLMTAKRMAMEGIFGEAGAVLVHVLLVFAVTFCCWAEFRSCLGPRARVWRSTINHLSDPHHVDLS